MEGWSAVLSQFISLQSVYQTQWKLVKFKKKKFAATCNQIWPQMPYLGNSQITLQLVEVANVLFFQTPVRCIFQIYGVDCTNTVRFKKK